MGSVVHTCSRSVVRLRTRVAIVLVAAATLIIISVLTLSSTVPLRFLRLRRFSANYPRFPRRVVPSVRLETDHPHPKHKTQAFLLCNKTSNELSLREVKSDTTPSVTTVNVTETACLHRVIMQRCYDAKRQRVPRVAHYVHFGVFNMSLHSFLSAVSVLRNMRPCLILFHGDHVPKGPYWLALLQLFPYVLHVLRDRPQEIFGNRIKVVEHSSDVARLQVLLEYGGVYLDTDHLVVKPVDKFFKESMVIGMETAKCGNGFFISEPNSRFLQLWLANYTTFRDGVWAEHSTLVPLKISRDFPRLVRVEKRSFFSPGWSRIQVLYQPRSAEDYDWSAQYGVHIFTRMVGKRFYSQRIDTQDNVMGDVARYVLYGDKILV